MLDIHNSGAKEIDDGGDNFVLVPEPFQPVPFRSVHSFIVCGSQTTATTMAENKLTEYARLGKVNE